MLQLIVKIKTKKEIEKSAVKAEVTCTVNVNA